MFALRGAPSWVEPPLDGLGIWEQRSAPKRPLDVFDGQTARLTPLGDSGLRIVTNGPPKIFRNTPLPEHLNPKG